MSERKLVSVQQISSIHPIKGADRIEIARVLGWVVVIGKDMGLKPGDKVAYFETDSLLPADDPRYATFQSRGSRTVTVEDQDTGSTLVEKTGHVLRTMKLRGVWSQGLVMTLPELGVDPSTPVGTDITRAANVWKWVEPLPVGNGDIIGRYDAPCSKSEAPRIQTLAQYWDELTGLEATPTVKVDGTSVTLWKETDGGVRVYSRNWRISPDCAQYEVAQRAGLVDALLPGMVVQYELCGPGVQSNRLRLAKLQPFVFAVWQDHRKLDREEWPVGLSAWAAPELDRTEWALQGSLDGMVDKVAGLRGNVTPGLLDEGVVWHIHDGQALSDGLAAELGANRCVKIINNKYLLKNGL